MNMNLFSIFDPQVTQTFSLNWISIMIPFMLYPKMYWLKQTKMMLLLNLVIMNLSNEMQKLLKNKHKNNMIFFLMLFYIIAMMNFMGLFPYIFTPTSHLIINLPISMTIWLGIMFFGWKTTPNLMFSHLVPSNTPPMLMPFMVLIETVSNLIRSGTLAIRLATNMIAGHILFSLLGNSMPSIPMIMLILLILIQLMLFILEMSVSIIQSYVFMTLSSLYSNEN